MLCSIGALRASGALDALLDTIRWGVHAVGLDTRFIDALPTALVKPFSGSAARAMLIETMKHYGVDSFPSLVEAPVSSEERRVGKECVSTVSSRRWPYY